MENGRYMPVVVPYQSMGAIVHILDTRTGEYVPTLTREERTNKSIEEQSREGLMILGIGVVVLMGLPLVIMWTVGRGRAARQKEKEDDLIERVIDDYSTYKLFKENYPEFDKLSKDARKKARAFYK